MTEETKDELERDQAMSRLLEQWTAPAVSDSLDERVLASYRREIGAVPLWRRLLSTSIRVPLPVAVAAMLLLLVAMAFALRRTALRAPDEQQLAGNGGATLSARVNDQPIVTRTSLAGFEPVAEMNVTVVQGDLKR
jgi:hypothetical protein